MKHLENRLQSPGARPNRIGYAIVGAVLGSALTLGGMWAAGYPLGVNVTSPAFQKFFSAYTLLSTKYVSPIPQNTLLNGAVSGMVKSVADPFTDYFTPNNAQQFHNMLQGSFVGIGVELSQLHGEYVIHAVISGSPAEKAGIMAGSQILAVNDKSVTGLNFDQVRQLIVGPQGSTVSVRVRQPGTVSHITTYQVKRGTVQMPTVYSKLLANHVAYLNITVFGDPTSAEVKRAYQGFVAAGAKALIVDVRDNPGGYLDGAMQIADVLIPSGQRVLSTVDRAGNHTVYNSTGPGTHLPIIVLMNQNTASAAEVLASALHLDAHAPLVGEKSYGKGTVQETYMYKDGSGLKYTVAKWLTADGHWIHHLGLQPTSAVAYKLPQGSKVDSQLALALQIAASVEKR